jgi:uncharacterized membrane protein HdeD (DUF308 family)
MSAYVIAMAILGIVVFALNLSSLLSPGVTTTLLVISLFFGAMLAIIGVASLYKYFTVK